MHLQRNATQRNATQRNATQRNATQRKPELYLNNNFKFYIFQFFRTLEFLSGFIRFAKIISFIKEKQNLCSFFYREKRTKKAPSFVKRSKTTPFRIRNSLVKTFSQYLESPSLRGFAKNRSNLFFVDCHDFLRSLAMIIENQFANLITRWLQPLVLTIQRNASEYNYAQWVKTHCYKKWIASLISFVRNDNFNYAFSYALKNKFEIISQSDYGFCYKNYFFNLNQVFRNSYDFGERFGRSLNYGFEKNYNGGFGKNYFGNCNFGYGLGNEICSIGNNLVGFLFNRKIKKINLCQRYSVGEGEQK